MINEEERTCLRCGCRIEKGQYLAYRFKPCESEGVPPGTLQAYDIDQHFHAEDCMVALKRKETPA